MPTVLTKQAVEKSTFVVTASFYDETDALVVPNSGLKWSLTDKEGNAINSRTDVAITPATSINIVLHGNDLAIQSASDGGRRVVTVEGTYNSSLGTNLELKDQVEFTIANLVKVT